MKKLLLILFVGFISSGSQAQISSKIDSLQRILNVTKEDSIKTNLYIDIGKEYAKTNAQVAIKYYHRAGELSKKIKYANGVMLYYAEISDFLNQKGLLDSALATNFECLQWAKKQQDSVTIGKALFNIGISYIGLGDMEKAVGYCEKGKSIFAKTGSVKFEGHVDNILQYIAHEMHQYRKGVVYGLQAAEKLSKVKDSINLCYTFNNLGLNYIELKQYDSAAFFLEKANHIALRLNNITIQITYNINKAYIDLLQGNFKKMKPFADNALELAKKYKFPEYEAMAYYGISNYHLSEKAYPTAKKYADSAMAISNNTKLKAIKLKVLSTLSNLAFAMQDTKAGFSYLNQYMTLNDSVLNESVIKNTITIEKRFETEKKEAQIKLQQAQLKQKSNLIYFLVAGAVGLLTILLLSYRNYRNRQKLQLAKIDELEKEQQLTATEAVLKGEEQERTRLAKDLHDGLGGMLSGIKYSLGNMKENLIMTPDNAQAFERSIDMLDSSIKEMRRVAHNMMPEVLIKYGLDTALTEFCGEIDRSGVIHVNYQSVGMQKAAIEQTTAVAIYRIVQELVNNVIKHAAAKNVLVQAHLSEQEELLIITVEDDGKGFDTTTLKQAEGMGWQNIQNRVEFLKGKTDIQSLSGQGTSVMIEIGI
ncbi:MAG: sensor histidine kinase [Bacteroidota bacterium]